MIDIPSFRPLLPDMDLKITAGKDNPIYNILQQYYITFDNLNIEANTSPEKGFFLDADLFNLMQDTTRIDTICLIVRQDSLGLLYDTKVIKTKYRKQQPFTASLLGKLRNTFVDAKLEYTDGQGKTGIRLGARVDKEKEGLRLHLFPEDPILAFRTFKLNTDNYILYRNIKDIAADVRLTGENNASLWIHSLAGEEGMEEIHAELSQIDLDAITKGFPDLPSMRGMLSADLQYAPSDSSFMVVADAHIDSLFYEGGRVGELMFNTVYLPLSDKEHQVDMHLFRDRNEVAAINAYYKGKNGLSGRKYEHHRLAIGDGKPVHSGQDGQTDGSLARGTGDNRNHLGPCRQRVCADGQLGGICHGSRFFLPFRQAGYQDQE